ncbi:AAA family ATPase [Psychrobacter sp. I-STPA10]|uniref:AAA family ATPase n=1 Tax=Psychrobacter sp. I-STPA10 TaxID=2585769 RepID=UPI001E6130A2|nr:AAA family ATPase [Psychrobacter sp. I-STPA10]
MQKIMQHKLNNLIEQLSQGLVQREDVIKTALLTLIAGENLLLIGPPGTAKSLLARRISEALIEDTTPNSHLFFEYLLTKFSTPEEIFGSLSLTELKKDNFHRKTAGYLPTAQVGFLDEIFKASSSILNTLLTILNERRFHNGTQVENVQLQTLIGASNELPNEQSELSALYDRFLLRKYVGYVDSSNLNQLFDLPPKAEIAKADKLTTDELIKLRQQAQSVQFPDELRQAIEQIWAKHKDTFKEDSDEYLSDRRFIKLLHILRISAVTNGRDKVDFSDVLLLKDALWNNANNAEKVMELVKAVLQQFDKAITLDGKNNNNSKTKKMPPKKTNPTKNTPAPEGSVIKGLKGSGTENDPFLIENVLHLCRLTEEKIGKQGYYFKQTTDIDCSKLTTWHAIDFVGHYDGGDFCITYQNRPTISVMESRAGKKQEERYFLFNSTHNTTIKNLKISYFKLIKECNNTIIFNCNVFKSYYGSFFIENINNSDIKYCHSHDFIFAQNVTNSTLQYCQSFTFFILDIVKNSHILDCFIDIQSNNLHSDKYYGGIASQLLDNSIIERVFIKGDLTMEYFNTFSSLIYNCDNSIIKNCALGNIKVNQRHCANIAYKIENATLTNNIILDYNASFSGYKDGTRISQAQFTQYYLENRLDWDFDTVWQWDDKENIPILRPMPDNFCNKKIEIKLADNQESLLAHQLKHNIWL